MILSLGDVSLENLDLVLDKKKIKIKMHNEQHLSTVIK